VSKTRRHSALFHEFSYIVSMSPRSNCRRRSRRRFTIKKLWRFARRRWREGRAFVRALWASHPAVSIPTGAVLLLVIWLTFNWIYHAINKPTEVFFPLDNALDKNLAETWRQYGQLFQEHATAVITPDLLAALAQVEGSGNPVARTYWRWRPSWNPLEWYQPASSAVGMYQLTDGTFQFAKRYCIHNHAVVEDGPWHDLHSCWFNNLYTRVLPSHAIELTAALLDRQVTNAIGSKSRTTILLQRKQELAAIIHLCGSGAGLEFVRRGFHLSPHQRCGDHDVRIYLTKIDDMKRHFARLAAGNTRYVRDNKIS
jgi:hypothetical protein